MLIVTLEASALLLGPVFDALSLTDPEARRRTTVPSVVQTTDTVMVEPDEADGVKDEHVAVPEALLKSPASIPETVSEKVSVYDNVREADGEVGDVHVAVGAVVSTLWADAVVIAE